MKCLWHYFHTIPFFSSILLNTILDTVEPPISKHSKCEYSVGTYRGCSLLRIEPQAGCEESEFYSLHDDSGKLQLTCTSPKESF